MSLEKGIIQTNLKGLRTERNLRQRQVAEAIGVTLKCYQAWEENRSTPKPEYIKALMSLYQVSYSDLMETQSVVELEPDGISEEYLNEITCFKTTGFYVYMLYRDNKITYIGMTSNPTLRKRKHKSSGRVFDHFKVWNKFDNEFEARYMERNLIHFCKHMIGLKLENVQEIKGSWIKDIPYKQTG